MSYATNWTKARPQALQHRKNPSVRMRISPMSTSDAVLLDFERTDGTQLTVTLTTEDVQRLRGFLQALGEKEKKAHGGA